MHFFAHLRRHALCFASLAWLAGLATVIHPSSLMAAESLAAGLPPAKLPAKLVEPPFLADRVATGALPRVEERLPRKPLVVPNSAGDFPGRYGGDLRSLIHRSKDVRLLAVYGYARLVGYDEDFNLVPDILEDMEIEDGRIFTLHLREGHRWSDGKPFTAEDFRYFWEDVANNEELSPAGPPHYLLSNRQKPLFEVLDPVTIRYSWKDPNPYFLPALAAANASFIFRPAHYLKQFHIRYADPQALAAAVEAEGERNWASLHTDKGRLNRMNNPELPTLQPWQNVTVPPSKRFVGERNPYFHRLDEAGHQLPYIDRFILSVSSSSLIPAKTGAGESDLQGRALNFSDYTFLKENEKRNNFDVRLWPTARASQLALYPNLNVTDPAWRDLVRDRRFRRALSLAIDRHEINQVVYFGLALEGNNTVLPKSKLYDPNNWKKWANFDLDKANELLDELGLTERNEDGLRLLPDGRPMFLIVESAGENTEESDVLELIHDTWLKLGIKLFTKPLQRELLRNRVFAGETVMAIWFGYDNGIPTADMSPEEFVPVHQQSFHWPMWGQFIETGGLSGEKVDMEGPARLLELYRRWAKSNRREERRRIWQEILAIHADNVYTIGIVAQVPQPVVVSNKLRNVPESAIFNWEPGAQFGIYRPDSFWFVR